MNEIMAFWDYDTYPYLLGGQVTEMAPKGSVETKEFGKGYYFNPKFIISLEQGKELKEELKKLEIEYKNKSVNLLIEYSEKANNLVDKYTNFKEV